MSLQVLPKWVENTMRSGNVPINPRQTKAADIESIIENAFCGNLEAYSNLKKEVSV